MYYKIRPSSLEPTRHYIHTQDPSFCSALYLGVRLLLRRQRQQLPLRLLVAVHRGDARRGVLRWKIGKEVRGSGRFVSSVRFIWPFVNAHTCTQHHERNRKRTPFFLNM